MYSISANNTQLEQKGFAFEGHAWLFRISVILLFLCGFGIRIYDLTDAPLDFHPTRQLYSALKARGMYYENLESAPAWQRELAVEQWKVQGVIEPPVMERLAAFAYKIAGQEILWLPRLFSILIWLLGGLALLWLCIMVTGRNGAVFALVFYLFTSYLVLASRSFQPDPLMVCLLLYSLWALVHWDRSLQWRWAVLAGIFAGFAIFIKTVAIFPIAVAFITVVLEKYGFRAVWKKKQVWLMAGLATIPYIAFYYYGIFINGQLQSQFSLRFFPQLWITPAFWLQWNGNISQVFGLEVFLFSILSTFLLARKSDRRLVLALFGGYFLYGLLFSYHISTHDYYQLPLIPAVALGIAAGFEWLLGALKARNWQNTLIVLTVISYLLLIKGWDVRVTLKRSDYRNEVQFWTKLGQLFKPEDRIIGITQDYGYRFEYWGWHKIENWMSSSDFALRELDGQQFDMKAMFTEEIAGKDYFLVTQMDELERQPQIQQYLVEGFPVFEQTEDYIIFDLQHALVK